MAHKPENIQAVTPTPVLVISVGGKIFYALPDNNQSAKAFIKKLSPDIITVDMLSGDGLCAVGKLPWELTGDHVTGNAEPGDIILLQDGTIAICRAERACSFVRLAKTESASAQELFETLGSDRCTVSFQLEWSE